MHNIAYQIYPSLLDAFQYYLDAEKHWEQYEGGKDNPNTTIDEYVDKAKQEFIDKVNRVPFTSLAADKGTAFNILIDCIIERRNPTEEEGATIKAVLYQGKNGERAGYEVTFRDNAFVYDKEMCDELAQYFEGSIPQYRCEGILSTKYGNVLLYGFLDELMPTKIHDIKTTSRYSAYKFRDHYQHLVYPFCIRQEGSDIDLFEYNVVVWGSAPDTYNYFVETYRYDPEVDESRLRDICERLIEFLINNKSLITNLKIFNNESNS